MQLPGRAAIPQRRPPFGRLYRRLPAAARATSRIEPPPSPTPAIGAENPSAPARVDLYDVLMDPEHPAFRDLGRLLWTMVATQPTWVDRRVETASLAGERRFRRHMSVDCRVPASVLDLAAELGLNRFLVPLRFVTKTGPLLAFDLRLDNRSVPWLTRPQNTMAAQSVLYAAVDQLGQDITPDLERVLGEVAGTDVAAADRALELLGLSTAAPVGGSGTSEELVHWLVTTLDSNFLLLADCDLDEMRHRAVFKITQELGLKVKEPLPLRSQIAWDPTSFVLDTPDVTAAMSYHFQFIAPDGMVIAGGELYGETADGDTVECFGKIASQGSVLGLNNHLWDVPEAEAYNVEVLVRPSPDGPLRASAVSAAFSTVLLLLASVLAARLDQERLDTSAALLLVLPGAVSTLLARTGEHHLVARLLRGVRATILASAVTVYVAAAVVVADVSGTALRGAWLVLALVSAIPTAILGVAVRRCRLRSWT
jgi:hypothetical protein